MAGDCWQHTLTYGTNGTVSVADGFGNSLSFTEDSQFQPRSLTTPNFSVAYGYDTSFRLLTATNTAGTSVTARTYHYENATYPRFLTGITDESNTASRPTPTTTSAVRSAPRTPGMPA